MFSIFFNKTSMKNLILSIIGLSFLWLNYANAAITFWGTRVDDTIKWSVDSAEVPIQTLIKNAISFLYLVAVVYWLWGWFNILTAWGNDEKVKKWKTIIIQALIGLLVIWLAASVVNWLVTKIIVTT